MNKSKGGLIKKKLIKKRCCCKCHKREKKKVNARRKSLQKRVLNMNAEIEKLRDRNMELIQSVHEEQREKTRLLDENEDLKIKYQSISTMYHEHVKSCFYSETEELMLAF